MFRNVPLFMAILLEVLSLTAGCVQEFCELVQ